MPCVSVVLSCPPHVSIFSLSLSPLSLLVTAVQCDLVVLCCYYCTVCLSSLGLYLLQPHEEKECVNDGMVIDAYVKIETKDEAT